MNNFTVMVIFDGNPANFILSGIFPTYEKAEAHIPQLQTLYAEGRVTYSVHGIFTTPISQRNKKISD
jgi:hypothetical protein